MFLDEIGAYLAAQGVGTVGSNIILGSRGKIPTIKRNTSGVVVEGAGPYLSLTETGGTSPLRVHNTVGAHVQRPSAQICVRATNYLTARTMAKAAYTALDGVFNTILSGVTYYSITAVQEPRDIGLDVVERSMIVFNIDVEKAVS